MSSQNAETIVRHFIATVWDEGKTHQVADFVTPDYVDHAYSGGVESLKAQIGQLTASFPGSRHVVEDVLVDGDRVMVRARLQGSHTGAFRGIAPSGAAVDVRVARWFRLEGDRIAEHWALLDTATLLRQIGPDEAAA